MKLASRRKFLGAVRVAILGAAAIASWFSCGSSAPDAKPNVILIMTDDQGYGDIAAHGNSVIKTPNLDHLASESVRLTDYHVSPYCIPTRASLMTGRYANRTGIRNAIEPHWFLRGNEVVLGKMFQDAGYMTGMFGKWHLGDNFPYGPEHRGFVEVLRHYGGAVGVLADYWDNAYFDDTYFRNGVPTKVKGYCTDIFFTAATRFIDRAAEQNKPFFVYLPTNAPHGPYHVPDRFSALYRGRDRETANFWGMISNIDENIGKLRNHLKEKGLESNTIFIFTTDNGTGPRPFFNAGMRGHKGSEYDGGHRVPFFIHWPAGKLTGGRTSESLTAHIDVAPTLLDLCGIRPPEGVKFDGVSLRALLQRGDHDAWPDRILMTDRQTAPTPTKWFKTSVMTERWRLVNGKELYDIEADPGQERNVYERHPEVTARLTAHYDKLWAEFEPIFAEISEIPLGHQRANPTALNYHDCIGRHDGWFQDSIRQLRNMIDAPGKRRSPFWPVEVVTDGEYAIELRRWPMELDAPIRADVPPGSDVPGPLAHRTAKGQGFPAVEARLAIGDLHLKQDVGSEATGVVFRATLKKGSYRLSAAFLDSRQNSLDAFYIYVTKLEK